MYISFSDIPNNTNLFLDYLYEFNNVKKYYNSNFRDIKEFENIIKKNSERNHERLELVDILQNQYRDKKISNQTQKNIEAFNSKNTFAVITGQQLGILGGPLYTLYKIITTIKLAQNLKSQFDGYNFVPVFWLEGDDHDIDEVRSIKTIGNNNEVIKITYLEENLEEKNQGSVGKIKFNDEIKIFFEGFSGQLRNTEFKEQLLNDLMAKYSPNKTFLEAFKELIFSLFDEYGLVLFDPTETSVKKLLTPIFELEIEKFRDHAKTVVERSALLEEIYHAQVKVRPINLFLIEEDGRYAIEPSDNDFKLKGKRKKFSKEELLSVLKETPEKFSPNVLLRPICQDYIFPTISYVGGPGEIGYFAQVIPLYEHFEITQPILYPRASATLLEKNIKDILDKYTLEFTDIMGGEDLIMNKVLNSVSNFEIDSIFQTFEEDINLAIDNLREKLFGIDKSLNDIALKSKERILGTTENLKNKSLEAQKRKFEAILRQIKKTSSVLYPDNNLQERELNIYYFFNKYGQDLLKLIFNELAINKFEHQIIEI